MRIFLPFLALIFLCQAVPVTVKGGKTGPGVDHNATPAKDVKRTETLDRTHQGVKGVEWRMASIGGAVAVLQSALQAYRNRHRRDPHPIGLDGEILDAEGFLRQLHQRAKPPFMTGTDIHASTGELLAGGTVQLGTGTEEAAREWLRTIADGPKERSQLEEWFEKFMEGVLGEKDAKQLEEAIVKVMGRMPKSEI